MLQETMKDMEKTIESDIRKCIQNGDYISFCNYSHRGDAEWEMHFDEFEVIISVYLPIDGRMSWSIKCRTY